MTWLKFSCTPGTGWRKHLLPFVMMACIGFAGSSAAAPTQPARHPFLHRGGDQHAGMAEGNQARALGVRGDVPLERDGTHFMVGATAAGRCSIRSHGAC